MPKYFSPNKENRNRGDATMSLMILIILASGVFLVWVVAPKMHDDTLNMASTGVVEGVKSDGVSGSSFAAAPGTNNESKKSLQMKQLILATATPTPIGPARTPTSTTTPTTPKSPATASIIFSLNTCEIIKGQKTVMGKILVTGTSQGYLLLEKEGSTQGSFVEVGKILFGTPSRTYNLILTEDDGVIDKKLRAKLFYTSGKIKELYGGTETVLKESPTILCDSI